MSEKLDALDYIVASVIQRLAKDTGLRGRDLISACCSQASTYPPLARKLGLDVGEETGTT